MTEDHDRRRRLVKGRNKLTRKGSTGKTKKVKYNNTSSTHPTATKHFAAVVVRHAQRHGDVVKEQFLQPNWRTAAMSAFEVHVHHYD